MEPETVRTGAGKCLEILTDYCTQLRLFVVGFFCLFQSRLLLLLAERSFLRGKNRIHRVTLLALMIAMDVVLSPLMRIEGMAPMSSVMNIIAGVLLGPLYGTLMALVCGLIRMTFLGIPPLALTGAVFGAFFAGLFYQWGQKLGWSMLGEIFGTGIIGSLLSYPVMVWFTGSKQNFYWFIYTPRFIGATLIGSVIAWLVLVKLKETRVFKQTQELFLGGYFYENKR